MSTGYTRRKFLKSTFAIGSLGTVAMFVSACGGSGGSSAGTGGTDSGGAAPAPAAGTGKQFTFDISAGDTMSFDKAKLEAEAGSKITVNFANKTTGKELNWVLAKPGKMLRVVTDGQQEGENNGYLKDNDENVIAHTKLLKPGESDTVTFDAPPAGEYQYFCTFPGFYTRLNGKLTVK
jgi:azurin